MTAREWLDTPGHMLHGWTPIELIGKNATCGYYAIIDGPRWLSADVIENMFGKSVMVRIWDNEEHRVGEMEMDYHDEAEAFARELDAYIDYLIALGRRLAESRGETP